MRRTPHLGSRVRPGYDRVPRVFDALERALHELFPALRGARITHRWGGPLGIGRASELTRLPWVGHRSPRWEPEPLRWLGANAALRAMVWADRAEARSGRPSRAAAAVERMLGR